jgi:hypothetical protein
LIWAAIKIITEQQAVFKVESSAPTCSYYGNFECEWSSYFLAWAATKKGCPQSAVRIFCSNPTRNSRLF